ncbi:histidine--tRNA ligase, partial [Candidatus Daviesbacteria bacterium]|nr:histidine--tRNA ligase [Candidatus Daviesbacteria bacterium]
MNKINKIEPKTLKGFRDFLPKEALKRQRLIGQLRSVFELFGFDPLETPALEYEEILTGKYGEEGEKLMYRFTDQGGRKIALRYDQTVPLARVIAQYPELPKPFKRYQIQPVWRGENPQKGRFREFLQCDIDIVGANGLSAEAEVISCALEAAKNLGFKNVKMLINDRSSFNNLKPEFIIAIDKLKKIGKEGVVGELIERGADPDWAKRFISAIDQTRPEPSFITISNYLKVLGYIEGVDFEFDPTLARGLDYYTGPIFELVVEDYKAGSLGGGGRFDKLISSFSENTFPAVGFSFGFDRLMDAMDELGLSFQETSSIKVYVTVFSQELRDKSLEIAQKLRKNGINTDINLDINYSLDKQLKYADQKMIPYAVIVGPEEAESNFVTLKNLKQVSQEKVPLDSLIEKLRQ